MQKRKLFLAQALVLLASLIAIDDWPAKAVETVAEEGTAICLTEGAPNLAKKLAAEIVSAYGGEENIRKAAEAGSRSKGKLLEYSTISRAVNTFDCEILNKGEKIRIELDVMGQRLITGYDGNNAWVQQGDQVFEANPTTEKRIKEEIEHGLILLLKFSQPETKIEYMGTRTALDHPCDVLQVISTDGKPTLIYADKTSHLVLQTEYQGFDAEQGTETAKIFTYEDYRPLDQSIAPYKVVEFSGKIKSSQTTLTSIEDADLPDKLFELPDVTEKAIAKDQVITVPFEYVSNEVIVKATANEKDELRLIVDTGATQSVLDTGTANLLGNTQASNLSMTTGSGSVALSYMTIPSLSFDQLHLKDVHFAVATLAAFAQIAGPRPSGLIGASILRRFLVTIDYPQRQLIFAHPSQSEIPKGAIVISTKPALGMSGVLVDGELDGHKLSFLVDTGAAFNNISANLAKPILTAPLLPVGDLEGLDGRKIKTGSVRFKTLTIGPLTVKQPVFSVAPSGSNPAGIISGGSLAILGNPLWKNYRVTIDYKNQRLILEQPEIAKQNQDALLKLGAIELKYLDKPSIDVVPEYRDALQEIRAKHLSGAEALCLANLALAMADKAEQPNSDATMLKMTNLFKDAQSKAAEYEDKSIESQVLSKWATYIILHCRSNDLARPLLSEAIRRCPTDASGYAGTALLLVGQHNYHLAEQLVDQALMYDPSNWRALWLKYDLAVKQRKPQLKLLVTEQLRQYYKGSTKVVALDTVAHTPVRARRKSRRSRVRASR